MRPWLFPLSYSQFFPFLGLLRSSCAYSFEAEMHFSHRISSRGVDPHSKEEAFTAFYVLPVRELDPSCEIQM